MLQSMRNNFFSIGEISGLYDIPIKTLRYYDEIGLLKPAKVDEESKYRYYSVEQFIVIDLIKNSKMMEIPLSDIKKLVNSELTVEKVEETVKTQIYQYEKKIQDLKKIQKSMQLYLDVISRAKSQELGKIHMVKEKCRYAISYSYPSYDVEDTEIQLRKAFLQSGTRETEVYPVFGAVCDYDKYKNSGRITYENIRKYGSDGEAGNAIILPEGDYLTVYFDEPAAQKSKYYRLMLEYIETENLIPKGDFNEMWLIPRLDQDQKESTLMKLDIQI